MSSTSPSKLMSVPGDRAFKRSVESWRVREREVKAQNPTTNNRKTSTYNPISASIMLSLSPSDKKRAHLQVIGSSATSKPPQKHPHRPLTPPKTPFKRPCNPAPSSLQARRACKQHRGASPPCAVLFPFMHPTGCSILMDRPAPAGANGGPTGRRTTCKTHTNRGAIQRFDRENAGQLIIYLSVAWALYGNRP